MKYTPVAFQAVQSLYLTKCIQAFGSQSKAKYLQATAEPLKNLMLRSMISCERAQTGLANQYGNVSPVERQWPTRMTCQDTLNQLTLSSLASAATSVENFPRQETHSEAIFTQCIRMAELWLHCYVLQRNIWAKVKVLQGATEHWKNWTLKSTPWCARLRTIWDIKCGSVSLVERWWPARMTCLVMLSQHT